ncbi:acetate kinase [Porphyromonadaceae bacterium COT-184 OH4590]|nr:acetate kinase [Porphyromonadaceae bacterium COT-184 OH4590]
MRVLVLNCGSSSIKYKLYNMDDQQELASGGIEKIGLPDSFLKFSLKDGSKKIIEQEIQEHTSGIELILKALTNTEYGAIKSLNEIDAVGHRVVHGGDKFKSSVVINQEVINNIEYCVDLAPLHNPANLKGIYAIQKILPNVPQVAVFDTSFHQTMPQYAYMYALSYDYYEKYGIRRYGFHGTSHRYVAKRACEFLGLRLENSRIITAHIGNGGSITAIKNGKSIDTSMGMTPVEGLMMGSRSGNIDLGILTYLMEKENLSTQQINEIINKKSGLLGISGVSSDMRDIEAAIEKCNVRAKLALDMYKYYILKYISGYIAVLGGVDAIVFTGGVGENQAILRKYICDSLAFLGVDFNNDLNERSMGREVELSFPTSKVKVAVIPTNEELAIAIDTKELING